MISTPVLPALLLRKILFSCALILPLWVNADYLKDARDYFNKGENRAAIIELKNLLQEAPNNVQGRLLLGKIYLEERNTLASIKELEQARELGADPTSWRVLLSRGYLLTGQYDELFRAIDSLEGLNKADHAELLAIIGHGLMATNQIIDAKETFQRALTIDTNAYAKVGEARIAVLENRIEDSLTLLAEALTIQPENIDALITRTQILTRKNEFDHALKSVNQALEIDNRLDQARLMRSELYILTGDLEAARADANQVLSKNADNPQAIFILARLQLAAQQYEAAQVSGEKILRLAPDHLLTHFILGATHYALHNFQQSKFYLEKFINAQPAHTAAARLLGATYLQLGETKKTIDLLRPFNENIDPQDAQLLNVLGRAFLQNGDIDQATVTFNRALAINPNIQGTRTQIALGEFVTGDIEEAVSQLESAITFDDSTEQTSIMLILSYTHLRKFDQAFAEIKSATQKYPSNGAFYHLKGLAFEAQQNTTAARKAYQEALRADKNYIHAYQALAKLDLQAGDTKSARTHYAQALDIDKNHLQTLLSLAKLSAIESNQRAMIRWLERARDAYPGSIIAVTPLVNHYLKTGDTDMALNEASRLNHAVGGKDISALSLMARVTIARNELDKATTFLQDIIALNSNDINHRYILAGIANQNKEYDDALSYLGEILELNAKYVPALVAKVGILLALENIKEAKLVIDQFAEYFPGHYLNQQLMGDLLVAQNQLEAALQYYQGAFARTKSPYLVNALVNLHFRQNQLKKVTETLEQYLLAVPNDSRNRLRLATTYQHLKQNASAIREYEQLAALGDHYLVLNNLSWLYWLEGDKRSLSVAKQAYQLAKDRPEVADTFGWIMLHNGDKKKALQLIQLAASRAPTNPDIRYHLAKALVDNGNEEQARKELLRLLRDYSGFSEEAAARTLNQGLKK